MPLAAKRPTGGDRLVGAQSLGVFVIVLVYVAFAIYVVGDLADGSTSTGNRLGTAALFGATSGLLIAFASARTFVRGDTIHVVSFFVTYLVPTAEIVGIEAENGMTIRVNSGRHIRSLAFGTSLIALITGNRRSKRAARRLATIVGPITGNAFGWTQDTVQARPRWAALSACLAITGLAILLAVL